MKKPVRKARPGRPGRAAVRGARRPRPQGGVGRRLLSAFFIMAAVPVLVFLAFDVLGLGQRLVGGALGDDPANALLAGIAAAIVAYFLGTHMVRLITAPLGKLAEAADVLSRGELPERLTIAEDDELGRLAEAFNTMADRLTGTISDLNAKLQGLSTELSI